jgi:hypothetical protein
MCEDGDGAKLGECVLIAVRDLFACSTYAEHAGHEPLRSYPGDFLRGLDIGSLIGWWRHGMNVKCK